MFSNISSILIIRLQMNDEVRSAYLGADPGTETAENTADDEHEALADVGEVG